MSAVKFLLLLQILALFFLKASRIIGDARSQMQCVEPHIGLGEKFAVWLGITEVSKVCLTTEDIVQNTVRALLRSLFVLLIAEISRTIGCYFLFKEGHMKILIPEENSRNGDIADWGLILQGNPNVVIFTNRREGKDEYLVRTANMLTTTTLTYNVHTSRVHSWTRPRLFVY